MRARLVQIEDGRRAAVTPLGEGPVTLGRDPSCDLVLDAVRVSRHHARIDPTETGHVLTDLNSANGTSVSGEIVAAPVELRPGDAIELGGSVRLVYELGSGLPVALAAATAGVALLLVGVLLWWGLSEDPALVEATRLAAEAVSAEEGGDYETAKTRVQSAVGLMLHEGLLDDVPRGDAFTVAMDRLSERLGDDVALVTIFERSIERSRPQQAEPASDLCRLDRVAADEFDSCLRSWVSAVMVGLRQDPAAVPERFYPEVGRRLRHERRFLEIALGRGPRFQEMMVAELERARMPPLLRYLALIESGYRTDARSSAGAVGLWQFMPGTGRDYGLQVGEGRDERTDPEKSTRAAAKYLKDLVWEFGGNSLLLALAGYNRGPNAVGRMFRKLDDPFSDRNYWALVDAGYLPKETAEYVSRFVAAAVAGEGGLPSERQLGAAGY